MSTGKWLKLRRETEEAARLRTERVEREQTQQELLRLRQELIAVQQRLAALEQQKRD